jgi:azurin
MKQYLKSITFFALTIALIACGGEKPVDENKAENEAPAKKESSIEIITEQVEINVAAKGESMAEIAFEPASLTLNEGAEVTLIFKNQSSAAGMLHNFVLVPMGAGQEIATAGISAGEANNFTPNDDRIIVATKMTTMGEEVTITFTAPKKGSYHYICTYPGHFPKMVGRLTVN